MSEVRDRIVQLAKDIQNDNRYGFINVGTDRYPRTEPAVEIVDAQ